MLSDGHLLYAVQLFFSFLTMEEKLDELLGSLNTLKKSQEESQQQITAKLDRLEQDVATGQEETLQLVAKRLKRDPEYQFRRKGNEKQFLFNEEVNDSIQSAASLLEKIKPTVAQDTAILKSAKAGAIAARYQGDFRTPEAYPLSG